MLNETQAHAIRYKKDGHIQHGIYSFLAFKCFIRCYNKHLLFFNCSLKVNSLFGIDTCVKGLWPYNFAICLWVKPYYFLSYHSSNIQNPDIH